jgi:hypothetical protein
MSKGQRTLTGDMSVDPRWSSHFSTGNVLPTGVTVSVDLREACKKLGVAFDAFSDEIVNRALVNTLNRACAPALTAVRRAVAQQTSIKYGRVMAHIKDSKAHPNRLEYRIIAKDGAIPLIDFAVNAPMGKAPTVKVWGKQRKLKGAFVFKGRGVAIVKRVGKHAGGIKSKNRTGRANVKTLWGPIIPREMIRPGFESLAVVKRIPERVQARLPHELSQAVARAKARSGT